MSLQIARQRLIPVSKGLVCGRGQGYLLICPYITGDFSVPFVLTSSAYALKYVKISNGKFPNGLSARLIAFRGLLLAKLSPRSSPAAFHGVFFFVTSTSGVYAFLANVSRWPTRLAMSE
jgi:hypothetical protein